MAKHSGTKSIPRPCGQLMTPSLLSLTKSVVITWMTNIASWRGLWLQRSVASELARSPRAATDLGLFHRLRVGSDKFPIRSINEAVHDNGRRMHRIWSRAEHRQCKGTHHFRHAENSPTRSEVVATKTIGSKPTGVDGRGKWPIGGLASDAARGSGDCISERHDPLHPC